MGQVSSIRVNGGRIYIESGGESRVEPTLHVDDQSSQDNGVGGVLKYRCITARFGFCGINAKERWESNTRAIKHMSLGWHDGIGELRKAAQNLDQSQINTYRRLVWSLGLQATQAALVAFYESTDDQDRRHGAVAVF